MSLAVGSDPCVTALLVSYNTRAHTLAAIDSLLEQAPTPRIVVLDNASSDGSPEALADHPRVTLVRSTVNLGFAAGVDRAAADTRGPYLLLLNPDARLYPEALARLTAALEAHPRAAAVGPLLRYPDGSDQESAFQLPGLFQVALDLFPIPRLAGTRLNGRYPPARGPRRVDHLLGACMLVRRAAWDDVGPLDPGYFMYVEEVDWCRRARARGWEIWQEPSAVAEHHGARSTRQRRDEMFAALWRSRLRYYQRYESPGRLALLFALVRLGMRAERRRARSLPSVAARSARLAAVGEIEALVR